MFRYLTSYRSYVFAKGALGLAYLWFITDFLRIHLAMESALAFLVPASSDTVSSFLSAPVFLWSVAMAAPVVVALFFWGRIRWLQGLLGLGMSGSMIVMVNQAGYFASTADVWLNLMLVTYALTALVSPAADWEQNQPGFRLSLWRENPVLASTYAWLAVLIQFTVYFFAGINKLVDGWTAWTGGSAIENLAMDSSVHDFVRGIYVPHLISLILCYVTLFQRLVVPFGFYVMRYRGWAVLILGPMHLGYAILMNVAIFPLVGIAGLFLVLPPRDMASPLLSRIALRRSRGEKRALEHVRPLPGFSRALVGLFSLWLLVESTRLTMGDAPAWEKRIVAVPSWRMFASGGAEAGESWRLLFLTRREELDATPFIHQALPGIWRDRLYLDIVLHEILQARQTSEFASDPVLQQVLIGAEKPYQERQRSQGLHSEILSARFEIYRPLPRPNPGMAQE